MCWKKMEKQFFKALNVLPDLCPRYPACQGIISTNLLLGYYKLHSLYNIHIFNISISSLTTTKNCMALFLHVDGEE